jgi:hypothetical protein
MRILAVPGVEITVDVNSTPLNEYPDHDAAEGDPLKGVAYVEAVDGAEFSINFIFRRNKLRRLEKNDVVVAEIWMDGKYVTGPICPVMSDIQYECKILGTTHLADEKRVVLEPFIFAPLQTGEQSSPRSDAHVAKDASDDSSSQHLNPENFRELGEVKVTCCYCRPAAESELDKRGRTVDLGALNTLPEKCLKGRSISSSVSYVSGPFRLIIPC